MSIAYHQRELAIALDPQNPARTTPPILPGKHKPIEVGHRLAPPNIRLVCAAGENLPFADERFDLVFSRVALPYMDINRALREIARVLKRGGLEGFLATKKDQESDETGRTGLFSGATVNTSHRPGTRPLQG